MPDRHVAIIGAGVWGTAFALHLARVGLQVRIWCRSEKQQAEMQHQRQHSQLEGIILEKNINISCDINYVVNGAFEIICMIPSSRFMIFLNLIKPIITEDQIIMWGCKGWVKNASSIYFHETARHVIGPEIALAAISGPTFADELANKKPTAVVLASDQNHMLQSVVKRFHGASLRCYYTSSMATVQFCGVYKNILAVAAGISDGLGLGANARSALITRGISEMTRVAKAMGLENEPIMGLSGQGDVILSCTSDLSRNRRLGLEIGRGKQINNIRTQKGMATLESLSNVAIMLDIAHKNKADAPITKGVNDIINSKKSPEDILSNLLAREPKHD